MTPLFTFEIIHNGITTAVYPLNFDEGKFVRESEDGSVFKRIKYNGKLIFSDSYPTFKAIEDGADRCLEISFKIYQSCDNGVTNPLFWEGYFSINDGLFDLDKCMFTVEVKTDDIYRCVLDNLEKEINILSVTPIVSTTAQLGLPNYEFYTCLNTLSTTCTDTLPLPTASWLIFHQEAVYDYDGDPSFEYAVIYYREFQITACLGGVPQSPTGSWDPDPNYPNYPNCNGGLAKFVRTPTVVVVNNPNPEVGMGDCNTTFEVEDDLLPPRRRKIKVNKTLTPTATIIGYNVAVTGVTYTFSVQNNPLSTYFWSSPYMTVITGQGTNIITASFSATGSNVVQVIDTNLCGAITGTMTVATVGPSDPLPPGTGPAITGPASICDGQQSVFYSWTHPASNVTPLVWAASNGAGFIPGAVVSGQGTTTAEFDFPAGTGSPINIILNGSIERVVAVTDIPVTPVMTGLTSVCPSSQSIPYAIQTRPGATYFWQVTGGTIVSGQGTGEIGVDWSASVGDGFVEVKETINCGCSWTKIASCGGDHYHPPFYWCPNASATTVTYTRGRLLSDIIQYMLDSFGCDVTQVSSDFFNINPVGDSPGYVADYNYVTQDINKLTYLMMFQKSDVIDPTSSNPATKGITTFNELMEILKETFNVDWFIDANGILRLEHESYFVKVLGYDLTLPQYDKYVKGTNKYSYEKSKMPKYERYSWMEAANLDFIGAEISYDSACTNQDPKQNVKHHRVDRITTDIQFIDDSPTDISKQGFVFMVNDFDGTTYSVSVEEGLISGQLLANAHLSWANLHYNYHRHGRVIIDGMMNLTSTTFLSIAKRKKQVNVSFPFCCFEVLDTIGTFIRTELGDGEVESAEHSIKEGLMKVNLLYE